MMHGLYHQSVPHQGWMDRTISPVKNKEIDLSNIRVIPAKDLPVLKLDYLPKEISIMYFI